MLKLASATWTFAFEPVVAIFVHRGSFLGRIVLERARVFGALADQPKLTVFILVTGAC